MSDIGIPMPPSNRDAEEGLIGSVLISPNIWPDVSFVMPQDFYYAENSCIWGTISRCIEDDIDMDMVTIQYRLEGEGKLELAGGPSRIAGLIENTPTSLHAIDYANIVKEQAYRRRLADLAGELAAAAYSSTKDPSPVVASITEAMKSRYNGKITTWADLAQVLKDITWSWQPWLPDGMVTIIAGDSGSGKSYLALKIAACFLQGDPWPDGKPFEKETGKVLWCEAEAAQVIHLGRARQLGLPIEQVTNLTNGDNPEDFEINNQTHRNILTVRAQDPEIKLIVIDSLSGSTSGKSEKDADMLELMKFLAALARDTNKPILVTHHLRKRGIFDVDGVNLERLRGSSAIVQTARVVWALDMPDPQAGGWMRLQVIKNNLARFPGPVGLLIEDSGMRFGLAPEPPRIETIADKAADLLMAILNDEPLAYTHIEEEYKAAGISSASINRAKKKLGVVSVKKPEGWFWSLPARGQYEN